MRAIGASFGIALSIFLVIFTMFNSGAKVLLISIPWDCFSLWWYVSCYFAFFSYL